MHDRSTHHVTTADGLTIVGTVHGHGPPLVLLHGIIGDGDIDWQPLLAHLTGRFTCHLPSWRGRGRSGRLTEGVRAFASFVFNDEEIAVADDAGYVAAAGRYVPQLLDFSSNRRSTMAPPTRIRARRHLSSGARAGRNGHQALRHRLRAARRRLRTERTDAQDPRRRTRRPADPP
jgi:hypothetical protein